MDYSKIAREVKERVDIVEIVSFYVKDLKKRGKNFVALCPFHSERTPSFTVSREKQIFYCFGCNVGGDVITFISKIEGISNLQALKKLANIAGINIEIDDNEEETPQEKERKLIKRINMDAALIYNTLLKSSDGKKAREFLSQKDIKENSILNFMLGYAPDSEDFLYTQLSKKYPKEVLLKTSLFSTSLGKVSDIFRDRLIIPIRSLSGDVIGFGARTLTNENPKYLNTHEDFLFSKRKTLFGLFNALSYIRKERKAIVVEGYFDVIVMHQYLFPITLSTMGTAFTKEQAHMLKNFVDEVIFMFDSDRAGINAAIKAADIAVEEGLYPKIATIEEGLDPDEFLEKYGPDRMIEVIGSAIDIVSFKINLIKKKNPILPPDKKLKAIEFVSETVAKEKNEIIKMEWIKQIAQAFSVEETSVKKIVSQKTSFLKPKKISYNASKPSLPLIEENMLEMLFKKPQLVQILKNDFNLSYLETELARNIISSLLDIPQDLPSIEEYLINRYPQYTSEILRISLNSQNIDEEIVNEDNFKKTLLIIEKLYLEKEIKKLKAKGQINEEELKLFNTLMVRLKNLQI